MSYPTLLEEIKGHNVVKYEAEEGPSFAIGDDIRVTWKAEGKDTGYQFCCYEVTLAPGRGIPLHKHAHAEFFCVLEGTVDFARWNDEGKTEWIRCGVGGTVLAPPNAPHTFMNRSDQPAKFMAASTYQHETMLKQSETPNGVLNEGYPNPTPEGFERLNKSQIKDQVYYWQD